RLRILILRRHGGRARDLLRDERRGGDGKKKQRRHQSRHDDLLAGGPGHYGDSRYKAPLGMAGSVLLTCESLTKSFTSRPLFENLGFAVAEGDHIGLIGPNGSGKSTLLKILAGVETPDSGTRAVRKGVRVGYVPQDPVFAPGKSVEEVLLEALQKDVTLDDYERAGRVAT